VVEQQPFRKDLSHLTWTEVYARQENRSHLIGAWLEALRLRPGERILEIGAGPGYVSQALAERVGPKGVVYAVDKSAEALAYLDRLRKERALSQIEPILSDAAILEPAGLAPQAGLITMVLHHAGDPAAILHNVGRLLSPGARVVIGEFHPEGPCDTGPPREHRIDPEKITAWCGAAGLAVLEYRRQSPEHYMLVVQRPV
jgi:ubiquinone/menaquinone biosynthesis C-methylase UbiE